MHCRNWGNISEITGVGQRKIENKECCQKRDHKNWLAADGKREFD